MPVEDRFIGVTEQRFDLALGRKRASHSAALLAVACIAWLGGCTTLPPLEGRSASFAVENSDTTRLGRAVAPRVGAGGGMTGIHALSFGGDAFAARMLLAMASDKALDLQYYIWHADETGDLLLEQVWRAAERGVRVRMLLDDVNTRGMDATLRALDEHPNIDVRLYNPLAYRTARTLNFLADFKRVNRRMHNKSLIADNQVAIVGGRNVGNEYFGAGHDVAFKDLDVIAVGSAVRHVSEQFDLYWNSASAYDAAGLLGSAAPAGTDELEARFKAARDNPEAAAYLQAVRETPLLEQLLGGRLAFEWTQARLVRDDPAKTLDTENRTDILLFTELLNVMGSPQTSFDLVSPYFVPGENGTAALVRLAASGVAVRVLTNSFASTDVPVVHAGYAKRRCELVSAGVRLFELKGSAGDTESKTRGFGASSATRLHAKTFAVDGGRIFVGSFNFDPRSARLNTEMGLIIDSTQLAQRLAAAFDGEIRSLAYEVRPGSGGACIQWIEHTPAGDVRHAIEPGTSALERATIRALSALPIDWLL